MLKVICLGSYVRDYMSGVISRGSNVEGRVSGVICPEDQMSRLPNSCKFRNIYICVWVCVCSNV